MRVHQDMSLVDFTRRLLSQTRRWSVSALFRFGPRLADFAIPDGRTMTVLLEGFSEPPKVSLLFGETSIHPMSCVSLSNEPGHRSWQAVFECPKPLPDSHQDLRLIRSGSGKVLRAAVREPEPDRPTRDATWDGARWVQNKAHAAQWRAQRQDNRTRITHVATGAETIRLSTTTLAGRSPDALTIAKNQGSLPLYQLHSEGDGDYRLTIAEFLVAIRCEELPERSTWRIWARGERTEPRELGLASRDLVLPRDVIVYPAEIVSVADSVFAVRVYWSAVGTLRISVRREQPSPVTGSST